jgi:hypothetical protein
MPEPLTIGAALTTAGNGVSLLNNIVTFVRNAQKAGHDPRLADVLLRMPAEAFSLAGQYIQQIQDLRQTLMKAGVDLGKSQSALLRETGKLYFRRRRLITGFSATVNAIETQLSRFLDDAVAVSDCCGAEDFVVESFIQAEEMRMVIHREADPSNSLGGILDSLEGHARELRAALGDMIKG